MRLLIILPLLLLTSCSQHVYRAATIIPYDPLEDNFVTDLTLSKSKKKNDLRDLLLTLPIFEISPQERRNEVYKNAQVTNNTVYYPGDGAQGTLNLEKMNKPDLYKLTYHAPDDSPGKWVYLLERKDNIGYGYDGWYIKSKQYEKR